MTEQARKKAWESRVAGAGCPLDAPRPDQDHERSLVAHLSATSLYLERNQAYRGHCTLIFDPRHVARMDQLSDAEWRGVTRDLRLATNALQAVLQPDHVNLASLGNMVPHLHWHLIPRWLDDPRWGAAIWTTDGSDMTNVELAADERDELLARLAGAVGPPRRTDSLFVLYVRDQAASRAFYRRALDREPELDVPGMTQYRLPDGELLGLMPAEGMRALLGEALPDPTRADGVPRAELYLNSAEPERDLARALEAGARALAPVAEREWGDRAGYCLDPDGHVLAFAASVRASHGFDVR